MGETVAKSGSADATGDSERQRTAARDDQDRPKIVPRDGRHHESLHAESFCH
jgi:hypothetical protein